MGAGGVDPNRYDVRVVRPSLSEDAVLDHPVNGQAVVIGRRHVVHQIGLIAVKEKEMHERHQAPGAILLDGILIFDGEKLSPFSVLIHSEGDFSDLVAGFVKDIQHHLLGAGPSLFELDAQIALVVQALLAPMLDPHAEPSLQHARGHFGRLSVLRLRGLSTHGRSGQRRAASRPAEAIRPGPANEGLGILRRIVRKPERPLNQPDEAEHAFFSQGPGQASVHQRLALVAGIGDKIKHVAHLSQLAGEAADLVVGEAPGIPVPRRRQVVRQHLVGKNGVNGVGPGLVVLEIRSSRFPPDQIGERRSGESPRNRHVAPAGNLVEAIRGSRQVPIPEDVDAHRLRPLARFLMGNAGREFFPPIHGHRQLCFPLNPRPHHVRHCIGIRF